MTHASTTLLDAAAAALHIPPTATRGVTLYGDGVLTSAFPVTDFAAEAIGAAGLAVGQLREALFERRSSVVVDRRLASLWFGQSIQPVGWTLPAARDPITGDYPTSDGWIRLHTNAARHKAAALDALQCGGDPPDVASRVARWSGEELEAAIVGQGGCAAAMRTGDAWLTHPQGRAVAAEPLVAFASMPALAGSTSSGWRPEPGRPLAGLRVLDLTRVLAGPVATRFLAGYGAEVLRIDHPGWDEPGLVPDVTLGKRCARLDLHAAGGRDIFERLLSQADILVHGYRPGALERLGYAEEARRGINPGIIDVSLDAYGWTGPWRERRGFDSLVQMSSGIAHAGMQWRRADRPVPLPVQAIDHATGYLMAAAVVRSLQWRVAEGRTTTAKLSLAATAHSLLALPRIATMAAMADDSGSRGADYQASLEQTEWGPAKRCRSPLLVNDVPLTWQYPSSGLGTAEPMWRGA
ncbi:MAG: CoA transferase [Janthinobacterium lividum]